MISRGRRAHRDSTTLEKEGPVRHLDSSVVPPWRRPMSQNVRQCPTAQILGDASDPGQARARRAMSPTPEPPGRLEGHAGVIRGPLRGRFPTVVDFTLIKSYPALTVGMAPDTLADFLLPDPYPKSLPPAPSQAFIIFPFFPLASTKQTPYILPVRSPNIKLEATQGVRTMFAVQSPPFYSGTVAPDQDAFQGD